jgi:hypothetical protein
VGQLHRIGQASPGYGDQKDRQAPAHAGLSPPSDVRRQTGQDDTRHDHEDGEERQHAEVPSTPAGSSTRTWPRITLTASLPPVPRMPECSWGYSTREALPRPNVVMPLALTALDGPRAQQPTGQLPHP